LANTTLFLNRLKHFVYRFTGMKEHLVAYCAPYNLKVKFHILDVVGRDIYYKRGVYSEDYITRFLLDNLDIRDNDLILDIGANIGWYSMTLSSRAKPRILAFEPDTSNFRLLQENLSMNGISNVRAFNKAVGDQEGVLTLHLYKKVNQGRHSAIKQVGSVGTVEVPMIALDRFLEAEGASEGPVKLIKIDIEGFEYTALRSATRTLARTQWILTEFSPYLMRDAGQDPMDYIRLLQGAGFRLREITEAGLHEPDIDAIIRENRQVNFICSRD
jgi:FkbM family methyltransferase